jgi:hypothetical protein
MTDTIDQISFINGEGDLSSDERIACLATCVVSQQSAGFRNVIDIREAHCPDCTASGFNTGWGYWSFACGAEILTDGEPSERCGRTKPSKNGKLVAA